MTVAFLAPFQSAHATVGEALDTILRMPTPHDSRFSLLNLGTLPFAMVFKGGTMVEALNTLARSREGVGWVAGVLHPSGEEGSPALQLSVRTFQ